MNEEPNDIQLLDVNIFSWHIKASDEYLQEPSKIYHIQVHHDVQLAFNLEQDLMGIRLNLMLESMDENRQKLGVTGHFGLENEIYVENIKDLVQENEGGHYSVDPEMGNTVMDLVYGTTRGIVLERTRGTALGATILPMIDTDQLLGNVEDEA